MIVFGIDANHNGQVDNNSEILGTSGNNTTASLPILTMYWREQ